MGLLTERLMGGGDAFLSKGFDNWKKALESFAQHEKSSVHREAVLKKNLMSMPGIDTQLNSQTMKQQCANREMLLKQLSALTYLLRQGIAIRGHEEKEGNLMQLLYLRSEDCPNLKRYIETNKYLSHDILHEQTALMGKHVLSGILSEIREASVYSLLADKASDVSMKEQLCICIRWVDDSFSIHEAPIELINVPRTDSNMLTMLIKDSLIRMSLPITECRGQAYDGAANMLGHVRGVAAQIQTEEPSAIYVHCFAHCINLVLQTVARQVVAVRDALDLVMGLAQLIRFSPKRAYFQSIQLQVAPGSPTLKPLCPTRWTVRTASITAVLSNYEALCTALAEIHQGGRDEYAAKAGGFLSQMEKFCVFFGLKLSHLIFSAGEQLSLSVQGKDTTIQEAVIASKLACSYLERQRTDEAFESFFQQVSENSKEFTAEPMLPYYRKRPRRTDDGVPAHRFETPKAYFR